MDKFMDTNSSPRQPDFVQPSSKYLDPLELRRSFILDKLKALSDYERSLQRYKELDRSLQNSFNSSIHHGVRESPVPGSYAISEQLEYYELDKWFETWLKKGRRPDTYQNERNILCAELSTLELQITKNKDVELQLRAERARQRETITENQRAEIQRQEQPKSPSVGNLMTEREFYEEFYKDIARSEKSILIVSPFMTISKGQLVLSKLRAGLDRGVTLTIHTKPVSEQQDRMAEYAEQMIAELEAAGATVIQSEKIHQKFAVIDELISYEGSLNILSHRNTKESMRRFNGGVYAKQILENLMRT